MECRNRLTTISVFNRHATLHGYTANFHLPLWKQIHGDLDLWHSSQCFVLLYQLGWKKDDVNQRLQCVFFLDVISSVQPHLPNTVLPKMSFWGEIHISSTYPRRRCQLSTQSALQMESRSDKHVNLAQHSKSVTNTAPDAQRKTTEDREKRKWMGTGKLPKEGRIESIQTNDHVCI